ncbi:MAG: capsule biosynthesis protein CapD, partial [Chloroflexota bacterium]
MFLHHLRNRHFLVLDLVLLAVAPTLALALRVEPSSLARFAQGAMIFTVLALLVKLPVFYFFGLYRRYWLYASVDEMITIALAVAVTTMIIAGAFFAGQLTGLVESHALPRSIPLVDGLLTLLVVGGTRFSVRAAHHRRTKRTRGPDTKRVLIVGAGDAGTTIARQIGSNKAIKLEPIGFVDADREKRGLRIHDVPVLGSRDEIPALVQTYDIQEVIIAMPSAPGKVIRDVVRMCEVAGVPFRTLPGID